MYYLLIGGHSEGKVGNLPEDFEGCIQEEKHEYSAENGWKEKTEPAGKYFPFSSVSMLYGLRLFRHESLTDEEAREELVIAYFNWMRKKHHRL